MAGPRLLRALGEACPRPFVVQIGANDGEQHDQLRPLILEERWPALLVEPVPYVFERLRSNYAGVDWVRLDNVAVAGRDTTLPFFHLREADAEAEGLPRWYDGIGSFDRDAVLSHSDRIPDLGERLVETPVPALSFESLLARHGAETVDLVWIDTEGYDWEILRTIDFDRHRPRMVVYEHFHLDPQRREQAKAHLAANGYATMEEFFDTWCVRPDDGDALDEAWSGAEPALPGVSRHDGQAG